MRSEFDKNKYIVSLFKMINNGTFCQKVKQIRTKGGGISELSFHSLKFYGSYAEDKRDWRIEDAYGQECEDTCIQEDGDINPKVV